MPRFINPHGSHTTDVWPDDTTHYNLPDYRELAGQSKSPELPLAWQEDPYAVLGSMGMGYKMPPQHVSHAMLRRMAEQDVVVASVHETIITLVCNFLRRPRHKYDIGFKIRHAKKTPDAYTAQDKNRIENLENWFLKTGYDDGDLNRPNLRKFGRKILSNLLTFDQIAAEVTHRRDNTPHVMRHVPAETIRLAPSPNPQAYIPPDKQDEVPVYVQTYENVVINAWTARSMVFECARARTTMWGYGYGHSPLETLINTVAGHLWAEQWNMNIFRNGSTIPGIINFHGNPGKQKLNAFRRQWFLQASGVNNAHKVVVTNAPGVDWIPLNWSNNEMGFNEWLAYLTELICSIYKISPELVGLGLKRQASMGKSGKGDDNISSEAIKFSKEKFLRPILFLLEDIFNSDKLLGSIDPRFKFEFYGIDPKDEEKDVELRLKQLQHHRTINEIRAEDGDEPLPDGDIPLNPVYTGYINQKEMMAQQQEELAAGGGPPGAPGGGTTTSQGRTAPSNQESTRNSAESSQRGETRQESLFDMKRSMSGLRRSMVKQPLTVQRDTPSSWDEMDWSL